MALLILFLLSIKRDVSQKQFPRVQANPTEVIPVGDNAVLLQGFEEAPYALWADPSVLDSTAHLALEVQKQLVKDSLLPVAFSTYSLCWSFWYGKSRIRKRS